MSEEYSLEIINPEKSFLSKNDVTEVVVPAFEGEIGILKDHISIISFLKPGIIKIFSKSGEDSYYVDDGIIEFKNNNLSILTSLILNLKDFDKEKMSEIKESTEELLSNSEISDQEKYLLDQKIEVLNSIN
jgi:F-type H+-transporting ATPase subunit epsilon/F-type H+-transporting ATPase subunit delta